MWCRLLLLGFVCLLGPGCAVAQPRQETPLFPDAATPPVNAAPPTSLTMGSLLVEITPVRFVPLPGRSPSRNVNWCGLLLRPADRPAQALVTIGQGITELLSCDGLDAIGPLVAADGTSRIGLLYRTRSTNAESITPIVLVHDPAQAAWRLDETISERLAMLSGPLTLPRMQANIGAKKR